MWYVAFIYLFSSLPRMEAVREMKFVGDSGGDYFNTSETNSICVFVCFGHCCNPSAQNDDYYIVATKKFCWTNKWKQNAMKHIETVLRV